MRARGAGKTIFCSFDIIDELEKCEFKFCDRSLLFLSSFFVDSSSSDFFCFLGTPNALSQAFKFGVADLSPGDCDFSVRSFSSFSLRSFSLANCSVDVTISSNSISSEQASFETESHNKSSSVITKVSI